MTARSAACWLTPPRMARHNERMNATHSSIADLRKSYERAELSEDASHADPLQQFDQWLNEALAAQVPDAIFMGTQRGEALARCYASADVFAFASLTETFGNVVPEAMASGLAILAYQHAAAGQLIHHGRNGVLAPAGDETTFLRLARTLASDAAWARHLGRQARETAQALDWQHIIAGIEAQYLAAMSPTAQATSALRPVRAG